MPQQRLVPRPVVRRVDQTPGREFKPERAPARIGDLAAHLVESEGEVEGEAGDRLGGARGLESGQQAGRDVGEPHREGETGGLGPLEPRIAREETGRGRGEGFNLNLPLERGTTIEPYCRALDMALERTAERLLRHERVGHERDGEDDDEGDGLAPEEAAKAMTLPKGFTASWTSGTIPAGRTQPVGISFLPTAAQSYNGTLTVNAAAPSITTRPFSRM